MHGAVDVLGNPERAGEVVPAPGRHHAERRRAAQRAGELADQAVASERHDDLAAPGRIARRVGGMGHVPGLHDPVLGTRRGERLPQVGQDPQRLAPGRGGVHQDREAAVGAHARRAR
jgi:hypothetical protein